MNSELTTADKRAIRNFFNIFEVTEVEIIASVENNGDRTISDVFKNTEEAINDNAKKLVNTIINDKSFMLCIEFAKKPIVKERKDLNYDEDDNSFYCTSILKHKNIIIPGLTDYLQSQHQKMKKQELETLTEAEMNTLSLLMKKFKEEFENDNHSSPDLQR